MQGRRLQRLGIDLNSQQSTGLAGNSFNLERANQVTVLLEQAINTTASVGQNHHNVDRNGVVPLWVDNY